jgi:Phage integrase family
MNQAVYQALSGLGGLKAEGLVFRKRDGRGWGNIRTAFEAACREAKVTDFRFHDLRHTCASWLVMKGRSLKEVQEILGHREFSMTLRYAHLSPDRLRDAVASLEHIGATPTPDPDAGANAERTGTKPAHEPIIEAERRVSGHAPVAQLDRATVS